MHERGCMSALLAVNVAAVEAPRLRLRRLCEEDVDAITRLFAPQEVSRYTALIPHPFAEKDGRDFVEGAILDRNANTRHVFALERRIEGGLIGTVEIHMSYGADTLGYCLGVDHWGHGYATEAVQAITRFAFQSAGKDELCAAVHPDNAASVRVLEKAGYTYDRVETGLPGRCASVEAKVYRLTAREWFAREAAKPKLLVSAVALVDADGRVLMAKRPPGKALAGLWEFPGGKVHDDETPEAALVRELDEELGIDIAESCLAPLTFASHAYEHFHLIMPLYVCRTWKGQVTAREGQELVWRMPNRLNTLPMPPADIPLVAMLMDVL